MNYLLVSVNQGSYQEIFHSLEDKIGISFQAQDADGEPALSIELANGTSLKSKYAKTTAADESPNCLPNNP